MTGPMALAAARPSLWSSLSGSLAIAVTAISVAVSVAAGAVLLIIDARLDAPGGYVQQTRAIRDDAAQRLLSAGTALDFERAKYVLEAMDCGVQERIRALHPAARTVRGE